MWLYENLNEKGNFYTQTNPASVIIGKKDSCIMYLRELNCAWKSTGDDTQNSYWILEWYRVFVLDKILSFWEILGIYEYLLHYSLFKSLPLVSFVLERLLKNSAEYTVTTKKY